MDAAVVSRLDDMLKRLSASSWKDREAIKDELLAFATGSNARDGVREHLENARKELPLEVRWDVDEVIEAITPPPPAKKEEPKKPEKDKGLSASDVVMVYDDPRGFVLYKTKKTPERWFATQVDPRTGQPQTFELGANDVKQLKSQLAGSPYWVLGSGEAPGA